MTTNSPDIECQMPAAGSPCHPPSSILRPPSPVLCLLSSALCLLSSARAQIPEPDNVVYGRIAMGTNVVTARDTRVVVEVRPLGDTNAVSTQVLASYRMGQDPGLGDHYAVGIPFWSPLHSFDPSPAGSNLALVVKETEVVGQQTNHYVRYHATWVMLERGHVAQIDFGTIPVDTGFDAWLALYGLADGGADPDADGYSNLDEYEAGTHPQDPNSRFTLAMARGTDNVEISFLVLRAEGAAYAGKTRHYTLQASPSLQPAAWTDLESFAALAGGTHTCLLAATNAHPVFYRGRVELREP
ncbi:MAG: hypothetical protein JXQ71_11730 [Verrucomicrobia bacterium]|nr:hypothetical protein [Verrucomicrobiota bacterium]